jgi:hypothetical protein
MELKFGRLILTVIAAMFPGGVQQFKKEKGSVTVLGHPSKEVVVYHPNLPDRIKEEFAKIETTHNCTVTRMEHPNFEGLDPDYTAGLMAGIQNFFLETNPDASFYRGDHSNLLVFTLPSVEGNEEDILEIVFAFLKHVEGLNLSYVIVKDVAFKIMPDAPTTKIALDSKIVTEQTEHKVISDDDVTNIRIDIERANSVEDFLKNL